jgi:hypothetical protein
MIVWITTNYQFKMKLLLLSFRYPVKNMILFYKKKSDDL